MMTWMEGGIFISYIIRLYTVLRRNHGLEGGTIYQNNMFVQTLMMSKGCNAELLLHEAIQSFQRDQYVPQATMRIDSDTL